MEKTNPILQALHQGIQTELQGLTLYRKAAERTQDPQGKKVFESLTKDELMHLRLLKVQYGSLVSEGRWVEMEKAKELEPGKEVEEIFPEADDALAALLTEDAGDAKALELALEFERRGFQLYQTAIEETEDPDGRALYEFLAEQEQLHYTHIQRAHEYLVNKGKWYFDEEERPFFEG
jgi:rubrerythrin